MAVPIVDGASPAGVPMPLFEYRNTATRNFFTFAPSPDGRQFLVEQFATNAGCWMARAGEPLFRTSA